MNHNYLFLLIFFYSCTTLSADNLGRLFLTPEQRAQLETVRAQRDRRLPVTVGTETPVASAPAPQVPGFITYNGVVRRSDGKSTVWISGKLIHENSRRKSDSEVSVLGLQRDGAVSVATPQAGRTASLKVGQRLEVTTGRIEESYLRREAAGRPEERAAAQGAPPETPTPQAGAPGPLRDTRAKESDAENSAASSTNASVK